MKKILPLLFLAFGLISCTSEFDQLFNTTRQGARGPRVVFQATTEGPASPDTKVYADESMKVLWNADDRISIFNKFTLNTQWAFTGDDGDTAGEFEEIPSSTFTTGNPLSYIYAAYPYSKSTKISNDGVLTMVLPAEQPWKEHSFGIGANTMLAVTDGYFLGFKNVGGYISCRFYGDNVTVSRITIKGNNGEKIAGKARITMEPGGVPSVTMDNAATDEISVVCDPAVKLGATAEEYTDFWFVIPPVYFSLGFTITVTDDKGGVFERTTSKAITVNRNKLDWMNPLEVVPNYDNVKVPFEDAEFKAYCVANFDGDRDGEISVAEAELVEAIDVCTDEIESLGGIEYFTNLKSLVCAGSLIGTKSTTGAYAGQLESIDIGGNILLEELDCHGNQLEEIDVSKNVNLETLICTDNPLETINLSPGQVIATLEAPEDTGIVYDWDDVIGPMSFPDANFRAYVFENFDTDQNGLLSQAECDAVTEIFVYTHNISSLKGVGLFSNLTKLSCYGTNGQLTSLDLSVNTALEELYCMSNQLTELDLSHNPALRILYCSENALSVLNISSNSALTYLMCGFNQLTSLDLSACAALEELFCMYNQLTELDVSHNLELRKLVCDENQLSILDVSSNLLIEQLEFSQNQISSLDVSHNSSLSLLNCYHNQLTTLDVSNNPLNCLNCTDNPLTKIYVATGQVIASLEKPDTAQLIEKGPGNASFSPTILQYLLKNYDSDGNGIMSSEEIDNVTSLVINPAIDNASARGIEYLPQLKSLECIADFDVVSEMTELDLSHNPELTNLFIFCTQISSLDLSNNPLLESIGLQMVPLNELDVSNNPALTTLSFRSMELNSLDVSSNMNLNTIHFLQGARITGSLYMANGQTVECINHETYIDKLYEEIVYQGAFPAAFPDENFRSYVFTNFDNDGNGILSQSECDAVTAINVGTDNIESMEGVTLFKNLESLQCDASGLDQGQLHQLNVSGLSSLKSVITRGNQLRVVDVSDCPALTVLNCRENAVQTLNASGCASLEELQCAYNGGLSSLDVSGCTSLKTLNCYNCFTLADLDVSSCAALNELVLSSCGLTSLDVSSNLALTSLWCDGCPLTILYMRTGQTISTLNLPEGTSIEYK
ncbi:MAG: hypothetical protein IJU08_10200 [Bacteroidales bacterium]|nr:hypothetical protein [Bacteroidales bacterium]